MDEIDRLVLRLLGRDDPNKIRRITRPKPLRLTVREFAFLVKRQPTTIETLVRKGKLKGRKKNGAWLIPEAELSKFWGIRYSGGRDGK